MTEAGSSASVHTYIVSVGSNIDPQRNVAECEQILRAETTLLGVADYIDTEPDGFKDQPWFVNGAYLIESPLQHTDFKSYLKDVERRLGRVKSAVKSGPRTMDLDIITVNDQVVHEDFHHKAYVIVPVRQLLQRFKITVN